MNKGDLIDRLYKENDLNKRQCREAINTLTEAIVESVSAGEDVRLVNFGTFHPSSRKETVKVHPRTGEKIEVPAKVVPKFRPGKGFTEQVQKNLRAVKEDSGKLKVKPK